MTEAILDPDLPIVDPHHHLWLRPPPSPSATPRYLLEEFLAALNSGHNVTDTVYMECHTMYRASGPAHLRSLGETEFANGMAAMSASGLLGPRRVCAGIVGHVDLSQGERTAEALEAHLRVSDRFRGVRNTGAYDPDRNLLISSESQDLYASRAFREGLARLADYGLPFDAWVLEPQLPELIDLVRAFPDQTVIVNHTGTPLGLASYQGRREERFPVWRENMRALAAAPNTLVKLGGLGMRFCNFPSFGQQPYAPSAQLAAEWKPYIETCIEAFGPNRCMFESNFPVDKGAASYALLWNAFKRLAAGCSADEKAAMFAGVARRTYRLEV
jgi:predicted TIM-barrel fold metal-dependent hydrolase